LVLPRKYRQLSSKLERKNEIFSATFETICSLMDEEIEDPQNQQKDLNKRLEDGNNENIENKENTNKENKENVDNNKKKTKMDEVVKVSKFFMEGKEQAWPNLVGAIFLEEKFDFNKIKLHGTLKETNPDSLFRMNKFSSNLF
jgi:hypothetical protein